MPTARAGAFSAFQKLQRPGAEAPSPTEDAGARGQATRDHRRLLPVKPPPPARTITAEELRVLLENFRGAVIRLSFQKALEKIQSPDFGGALKKRAGVAKLLSLAWVQPFKAAGFAIDGYSFPRVLAAIRSHSGQLGIRSLSEEVEKNLKFFPGALFGERAGGMKGLPKAEQHGQNGSGQGAFSKLATGVHERPEAAAAKAAPAMHSGGLRGRPMGLGEAKDILKRLKADSSTKEFQRGLADTGRVDSPESQRASASFVCRCWASALSFYDFPVTPAGFRELATGIAGCAYNRHVELLAHDVERLLHVPPGSFFGISADDGDDHEEGLPDPAAPPRNPNPGDITIMLRHKARGTELEVSVPRGATFWNVKEAAAIKLGSNMIKKQGRLVKSTGAGTFAAYNDSQPVGNIREVLVLGAELTANEDASPPPLHKSAIRINFDDLTLETQPEASSRQEHLPALTKESALQLMRELHAKFSDRSFQRQLTSLYDTLGGTAKFIRERQLLTLSVQSLVLPKYGFKGTIEGVIAMKSVMSGLVSGDPEMARLSEEFDELLKVKALSKGAAEKAQAASQYRVRRDRPQPEPEEPPKAPEPKPPPAQEPPKPSKPPPKSGPPPREVRVVLRHALNANDEEVWMTLMSNMTFLEVKNALANKLGRSEVRMKGRLVFRAEGGVGVWTDFLDEEELGHNRKVVHILGIRLPSKEIQLVIRHAIKQDSTWVQLSIWTHWKFREVRSLLADKLGRPDIRTSAKFVFKAQGNWVAFKDDEQVGNRTGIDVMGLDDLEPSEEVRLAAETSQIKTQEAEHMANEDAAKKAKVEAEQKQKAKEENYRKLQEEAHRRLKDAPERRLQEETERKAQEFATERDREAQMEAEHKSKRNSKHKEKSALTEREQRDAEKREREAAERKAEEKVKLREKQEAERRMRDLQHQWDAFWSPLAEGECKDWEEAERNVKEKAEQREREEAKRKEVEAERRAKIPAEPGEAEEAKHKAREEAKRKAKEEAEGKATDKAEREARQEAEHKARQEAAREEAERKSKEETKRKARKEAEHKARQEAAREEGERKSKEEIKRKARVEAEHKARQEAAREEAERKSKEEIKRKAREEAEHKAKQEAAREEAERKSQEEIKRRAGERAEYEAKQEADRKAKQDAERRAAVAAERKAREEAEREAKKKAEFEASLSRKKQKIDELALLENKREAEQKAKELALLESKREAEQKAKELALLEAKQAPLSTRKQANADRTLTQREAKARLKPALYDQKANDGPIWIVMGGGDKGGILVRKGEEYDSKPYPFRLVTGSRVEQMDIVGNRFHYRRIHGDGPDFGWVNIRLNDKVLLEPEEPEF